MDLDPDTRRSLNEGVAALVERHAHEISQLPVTPQVTPDEVRSRLAAYDLEQPMLPMAAVEDVVEMLTEGIVHTPHPRYFGLFNPAPTFMGILGDYLAAAFNPQLAAWSHAPVANEIERHLLEFFGGRVGFESTNVFGSFTTGGAEANLTAVLVALTRRFPEAGERGLRDLDGQPTFYASEQSHLAWLKIAHACGLGRAAVRLVPVGKDLALDVEALNDAIEQDQLAGELPFLVAATAGTTSAGVIDPLDDIAEICRTNDLFFHVDAAWGGAAVLSDRLRPLLKGIEQADSVTLDAHKWLSVPMGAGMFLTRDVEALAATFRVSTSYMPSPNEDSMDPYTHSIQWSRRFIGLKVFLSLASTGRVGYASQIERDCELGQELRELLARDGWTVVNDTPLPVVCFVDEGASDARDARRYHFDLADRAAARGRVWISSVELPDTTALRACITSFRTRSEDLMALVQELNELRRERGSGPRKA